MVGVMLLLVGVMHAMEKDPIIPVYNWEDLCKNVHYTKIAKEQSLSKILSLQDLCLQYIENRPELLKKISELPGEYKDKIVSHLLERLEKCDQNNELSEILKAKINMLAPELSALTSNFYGWKVDKKLRWPCAFDDGDISLRRGILSPDGKYILYQWAQMIWKQGRGSFRDEYMGVCDREKETWDEYFITGGLSQVCYAWAKDDSKTYIVLMWDAGEYIVDECFLEQRCIGDDSKSHYVRKIQLPLLHKTPLPELLQEDWPTYKVQFFAKTNTLLFRDNFWKMCVGKIKENSQYDYKILDHAKHGVGPFSTWSSSPDLRRVVTMMRDNSFRSDIIVSNNVHVWDGITGTLLSIIKVKENPPRIVYSVIPYCKDEKYFFHFLHTDYSEKRPESFEGGYPFRVYKMGNTNFKYTVVDATVSEKPRIVFAKKCRQKVKNMHFFATTLSSAIVSNDERFGVLFFNNAADNVQRLCYWDINRNVVIPCQSSSECDYSYYINSSANRILGKNDRTFCILKKVKNKKMGKEKIYAPLPQN